MFGPLALTRLQTAVFVASAVLFTGVVVPAPGDDVTTAKTNALALFVSAAATGALVLRLAPRVAAGFRQATRGLATACLLFGLGQLSVALGLSRLESHPTQPRLVDVLSVLALVAAAAGLLTLGGQSVSSRLRTVLDAVVVLLALLFAAWAPFLGPAFRSPGVPTDERVVTFVFVAGGFSLLGIVLVLAMRWRGSLLSLVLLLGVFVTLAVTNAWYGVHRLEDGRSPHSRVVDLGWFLALWLLALLAVNGANGGPASEPSRWWIALFVPYAATLVVVATAASLLARGTHLEDFLLAVGALFGASALVRQLLLLRDHHALVVGLERTVAERTQEVERYDAQLRALLRGSPDLIAVLAPSGRLQYANEAAQRLLGRAPGDLLGTPLMDLVHPDDHARLGSELAHVWTDDRFEGVTSFRVRSDTGRWVVVEASASQLQGASGLVLNIRDVSARAAESEELRQLASYDGLTALVNRRVFDDRVHHALDRARRTGEQVSVLYIDLDNFKSVNDRFGHAVGDQVLVTSARTIRSCVRPADTAARLGGDEFAVLLEDTPLSGARYVGARITQQLSRELAHAEGVPVAALSVTASVGVTSVTGGSADADELLRDADVAMYRAKSLGGGRVEALDREPLIRVHDDPSFLLALRAALHQDALQLVYQPMVRTDDHRVVAVEALIRWVAPSGEVVPPSRFLPAAERDGIVPDLERWVLDEACRRVAAWRRLGAAPDLQLHVNVSASHLDERLEEDLSTALRGAGLELHDCAVEISDRLVDPSAAPVRQVLGRLQERGVEVWLDHFGSGRSSFPVVQGLPLTGVKVDLEPLRPLAPSRPGARVVRSMVQLARAAGLSVVALGVETLHDEVVVREAGCQVVQGNLFAAPMHPEDLEAFLLGQDVRSSGGPPGGDGAEE